MNNLISTGFFHKSNMTKEKNEQPKCIKKETKENKIKQNDKNLVEKMKD